ncbi:DUF6635 family protein [Pseudooceanicola spongiae]|uniref:Uncharacterized protein n=1 Tax=Pseudooceanicola spongiae TaxID=2613965 RepID=A0A7M3V2T9_9RHOB|nr:DUF6635 family protein [Pseudooceanicola spongiae]QOL79402.1 hypothetical protein F3W81_00250 [Pseudooceanicola spongiae]
MTHPSENNAKAVRDRVDTFVRAHFHFGATIRLHSTAFGWDLLRAPINVVLAPIFLLMGLTALLARVARLPRLATWLSSRHILLKTSVAQRVETAIISDLLENAPLTQRSRDLIDHYTSVRSAVAEITTSLLVLFAGLAMFGAVTPGIASLAPQVSGYVAHASAVAHFPLGSRLGMLWYDVFPVSLSVWFVVLTATVLAMVASVVTTFAGIIADPLQALLGVHRRRLMRLLEKIAVVEGSASGLAPEHILARLADLIDAGISLVRVFRS